MIEKISKLLFDHLFELIITILFLGIYFYEKQLTYLFHFIGLVIMFILASFGFFNKHLTLTAFNVTFGLIAIFGYKFDSTFYKAVLFLTTGIFGIQTLKSGLSLLLSSVTLPVALGITFAIGYIFILNNLGFDLIKQENEDDEDEEEENGNKTDHVCATFKGTNFVNFSSL